MKFALRASATTWAFLLLLTACGGGGSDGGGESSGNTTFSSLQDISEPVAPAVANGPQAAALADCVFNATRAQSCTLTQLPFIGASTSTVTVDDVMARVVTSRPWMAQRLRELLQTLPPDLLQMMKPVTAIVVGSKVRPSFYWLATGALYIDPQHLWTTPEELADVDKTPDYRTDFGQALQFTTLWRYVKDDHRAYLSYSLHETNPRSIDDIRIQFAHLILHELAHAGDFAPPRLLSSLSTDKPLLEVLNQVAAQRISSRLYLTNPLRSTILKELGEALFRTGRPTAQQQALSATDVSREFTADRASDDYSYASQYEDVAMLAEEALMRVYYGVSRDIAVTPRPTVPNPTANDYIVTWGTRGRIGQEGVKQAAAQVVDELLPHANLAPAILGLPAPTPMRVGASWWNNLVLDSQSATAATTQRRQSLGTAPSVAADLLKPY
ncbi:hypothetical protein [uncultured Azohydromonas sp.]|jgi:hypothetical protein|uniref:hypothetical protein n=1 Tax=uncultured Azohydromonas sp. TaxID=487342 RepID=UPI00260D5309|nr:hypothetical protein [uncultured Azohydromonas sp.]